MATQTCFSSALLIEDEPHLLLALSIALQKLGISVRQATTLKAARAFLAQETPEFVLLDRTLPDGDGLSLCSSLRREGYTGSILVLTALGRTEQRVQGLDLGADDYLPKPFSWEELEARIRALSRRKGTKPLEAPLIPSADPPLWHLDWAQLRIFGPKGWVSLTPLEFKLAATLIQRPNRIVSRGQLLTEVWGFTLLPKTRTVDHFLGRLRKYFETTPDEPSHFVTVRGAGYLFSTSQELPLR